MGTQMIAPGTCARPVFVKVRIDADAIRDNHVLKAEGEFSALDYRPVWWLQMPNGLEVRAREIAWNAPTASRYRAGGTSWNLTVRVSAWLEVYGPVIADGKLYDPNTEK